MNLHPALVHFPIALLTVYAMFELFAWKRLTEWSAWFYIKAVILKAGTVSAVVAYLSGNAIEAEFSRSPVFRAIIHWHSTMAMITILLFGLMSTVYAIIWINKDVIGNWKQKQVWIKTVSVANIFMNGKVIRPLALVGLLLILTTGALGGGMVHGKDVDPMVKFVYQLFGL